MNIEAAVRLRLKIDKAVDVAIQDVLAEAGSAELVDLIDIIKVEPDAATHDDNIAHFADRELNRR